MFQMVRLKRLLEPVFVINIYFILFYSIFDVYYTSSLVHGTPLIPTNATPLATHLILIVSDGLRADKLFGEHIAVAPFIKNIILRNGSWGLSHTRVPTESRPGHIAIFGGFYEDVASITKGWKENAVEFDSVLNRSLRAWAWGTKEVIKAFTLPHVRTESSPAYLSELGRHNITDIDRWTVDKFLASINDTKSGFFSHLPPSNLGALEMRRGQIAFLHLDAADMIGHSLKPGSPEYRNLVHHLDSLIAEVVFEVSRVSTGQDVQVAFILTADHGMTDWGSHGAGSLHETSTPLLAWGAGIKGPEALTIPSSSVSNTDEYGIPVHNHGRVRREIQQIDLCPLMASLLGVPIPANSVGRVPLSLLSINQSTKAQLVRANCEHLVAQLRIKRRQVIDSHLVVFFQEFSRLSEVDLNRQLHEADLLLSRSMYDEAIQRYELLSDLVLDALNYYHKYDRTVLGFCIGATFMLWSLIVLCSAIVPCASDAETHSDCLTMLLVVLAGLLSVFGHRSTLRHFVYQAIPLLIFVHLFCSSTHRACLSNLVRILCSLSQPTYRFSDTNLNSTRATLEKPVLLVSSLALLELIILGFSRRSLLSLACLLLSFWPFLDESFGRGRRDLRHLWCFACGTLAVFPQLPLIGSWFSPFFVCMSGICVTPLCFLYLRWLSGAADHLIHQNGNGITRRLPPIGLILIFVVGLSGCLVAIVHSGWGFLPYMKVIIRFLGWSKLISLPLVVFLWCPPRLGMRVFCWFSVLLTLNILLSTGYEPIFFSVFATVCLLWIQMETHWVRSSYLWSSNTLSSEPFSLDVESEFVLRRNIRQSLFFICLLVISFFGTGNIASVNSFDPRSTYVFVSRLKPAEMAPFLLIKVLCPMLYLGIVYGAIQWSNDHFMRPKLCRSSAVIQTGLCTVMSNFVSVHFFFWLRDEGSWLDIGTSISHYVIAMAIGLVAFLFGFLGRHMLVCRWHSRASISTRKHF